MKVQQKEKIFTTLFEDQESGMKELDDKIKDVQASNEEKRVENETHEESLAKIKKRLKQREFQLKQQKLLIKLKDGEII